jgi:hypothetical protein
MALLYSTLNPHVLKASIKVKSQNRINNKPCSILAMSNILPKVEELIKILKAICQTKQFIANKVVLLLFTNIFFRTWNVVI